MYDMVPDGFIVLVRGFTGQVKKLDSDFRGDQFNRSVHGGCSVTRYGRFWAIQNGACLKCDDCIGRSFDPNETRTICLNIY